MHKRIPLIARDLKRLYTGFLIAALALFVLCSWLTEFNPMTLIANGEAFVEFITQDFLPPALPKASCIPGVLESVVVTLALALSSTTVAAILAFFVALFGMLAARNVFRIPVLSVVTQAFFTFLRAVPTPVWVLLMLVCLGVGPEAGVAGLCVHTTAFFTKSFAQSFESIPQETIEALEVTGASRLSIFCNAILPAAFSQIVA